MYFITFLKLDIAKIFHHKKLPLKLTVTFEKNVYLIVLLKNLLHYHQ